MRRVGALLISIIAGTAFLFLPDPSLGQQENIRISTMPDTVGLIQQIKDAKAQAIQSPDSALSSLSRILRQSQMIPFGKGIRNALLNMMYVYYENERYEESIEASKALLNASDSFKNRDAYFYGYYGMALALHRLSRPDVALNAYTRSLYFLADTAHKKRIGIYSNMGELVYRMGQYEKALSYFSHAIQEGKRFYLKDSLIMISPYINMACSYGAMGNFLMTDSCFAMATRIAERHRNKKALYDIKRLQVFMYNQRKQPRQALATIQEAWELLLSQPLKDRHSASYQLDMHAGEAYLQLRKYVQAEPFLKKALDIIDSTNYGDRSIICHKLSRLYDSIGNYRQAYTYLKAAYALESQVKDKEIQMRFNEAEIRYKTAEKDKALAEKNLQLTHSEKQIAQKNLLIVSLFFGGAILILLFLWLYFSLRRRQKINRQQQEIEQLKSMMKGEESERRRLARELHDGIGGMLTAIKLNAGSLKTAYPDTAHEKLDTLTKMLTDASAEVRTTAHNLMPDSLTRYGLRDAIIQYIEKINSSSEIQVDFHNPNHEPLCLDKPVELILYRMVQELIQNVIKHAEANHIALQLLQHNGALSLTLEDNGKGFDPAHVSGFGLENLRYRVEALHGEIDTESTPGRGTTIRIHFDLEKLKEITT